RRAHRRRDGHLRDLDLDRAAGAPPRRHAPQAQGGACNESRRGVASLSMDGASGRLRILIAEDDPDVLRMLETVLRTLGDVVIAKDGQEALEIARAGPTPDLIVTDVMMPRMDGLTLAKQLKSHPHLARVPLVMLTARTGPRDVIAGINAGARFYVTKPFKTDELISKVRKALGLAQKK